ncbi:NHL repeat-containing protein [Streptomyces sp900129855]|uniref:NHL repeat-containing protein n=1 Tax=Streptomyces sp. 900129855 TaxID=3155129 RepID=A0ABV2ZZ91_9ACTN
MKTVKFVSVARRAPVGPPPGEPTTDVSGGWRVETCLGAPAVGGLMLPAAHPTASWMYAPRGVHVGRVDGHEVLVVADTGNHRVLIWQHLPERDGQPCDVVLGQPDMTSEGAAAGGRSLRYGMNLPTGVLVHDGMLIVADAWHHRVLIYRHLPEAGHIEPDLVLGQPDLESVEPNRGGGCSAMSLYWPFGVGVVDGRFYVADTGNRRVLGWSGGVPTSAGIPPDLVLGQSAATHREENRGGPAGRASFRWPHDVAGTPKGLLIADAGNHRLLGWSPHPTCDGEADLVIGQSDFETAVEWPYGPQSADKLRFPYALEVDAGRLAVADTANNRVLIWDALPDPGDGEIGPPADVVLGQPGFSANGENRWDTVTRDSMCWPYGLSLRGDLLAVADSGNNRVVLWRRT